jgi:hypothetical protein
MDKLGDIEKYRNAGQSGEAMDNIESFILLFVDKSGEVGYNVDWSKGIEGFAKMFFSMAYSNLLDDILNDMEQECVKTDRVEEFEQILLILTKLLRERNAEIAETTEVVDSVGDSVVVSPLSDPYFQ